MSALCACNDVTERVLCVPENDTNNILCGRCITATTCVSPRELDCIEAASRWRFVSGWDGWSAADSQNLYCYSHDTVGFLLFP